MKFLIFLTLLPTIVKCFDPDISTYRTLPPEIDQRFINRTKDIQIVLLSQYSHFSDDEVLLGHIVAKDKLQVTVCGNVIPRDYDEELNSISRYFAEDSAKFRNIDEDSNGQYLPFDVRTHVNNHRNHWELIEKLDESATFVMSLELKHFMNINVIKKFKIRFEKLIVLDRLFSDLHDWFITKIDIYGECIDSQNFDDTFVTSSWISNIDEIKENISADQFAQHFVDTFFDESEYSKTFSYFSNTFKMKLIYDQTYTRVNNTNIIEYMNSVFLQYDLEVYQTDVIAKNIDQIVFRTLVNYTNRVRMDSITMWSFQIEAIYNVDDDDKWKITRIFVNRPISEYNQTDELREWNYFEDYVEGTKQEIKQIARSEKASNKTVESFLFRLRFLKRFISKTGNITFKNDSDIKANILQIFKRKNGFKLRTCRASKVELFALPSYYRFHIQCWWKNKLGIMDTEKVEFVWYANFYNTFISSAKHISTNLEHIELSETDIDFEKLVLDELTLENLSSRKSERKIVKLIDLKNLNTIICGEKTKASTFFNFLGMEKRRYEKENQKKPNIVISKSPNHWNVTFSLNLTSSMNFIATQNVTILMEKDVKYPDYSRAWKIRIIEIGGSCLNSLNFDKSYIQDTWSTEKENKRMLTASTFFMNRIIQKIPFTSKCDHRIFDKNFSGLIDISSKINFTFNTNEFLEFMKILTNNDEECAQQMNKTGEIKTDVITQKRDHVVFQAAVIIENDSRKYSDTWFFIIEAGLNSDKTQWKIKKLILRPSFNYIENIQSRYQFLSKYMKKVKETRVGVP